MDDGHRELKYAYTILPRSKLVHYLVWLLVEEVAFYLGVSTWMTLSCKSPC